MSAVQFLRGRQPERAAPKPLVDPVNKIILFWMHRCGSTTGQLWFFHVAGWEKRMKGKGASQLAPEWYAEHAEAYERLDEHYRDPSFLKIAVVRNPLSRAVSAFSVVTDTISGSQWRAVSRSIAEPDGERRISFEEFLDFLEGENLATANYHWRLQSAQDCFDLALPDIELARLETLQQDLDRLCGKMGKRPVAMRMNSAQTKVDDRLLDVDISRMVRSDFARAFGRDKRGVIRFPDFSRFLNERTIPRIARLYAKDFETLGYKPEL
jgi:hypothetical protein